MARETFKAELAQKVFGFKLSGAQTNAIFGLLEEDNYANLLQDLKAIKPPLPEKFILSAKSLIVGTKSLQSEVQEGLLEQIGQTETKLKELTSAQLELEKAKAEILELRRQLEQTRLDSLKPRSEQITQDSNLAAPAPNLVTPPVDADQSSEEPTPPPPPAPPPPPPPPPPKPKGMDDTVMTAFGDVLKELQRGKALKKAVVEPKQETVVLSMRDQFKKDKEARKAKAAAGEGMPPAPVEPPEVRQLKLRIVMAGNRVAFDKERSVKADKEVANLNADIKGLEETLARAEAELVKEKGGCAKKSIKEESVEGKKILQPIKDKIEITTNELKKKKGVLGQAEKKQTEENAELAKATDSFSKLKQDLDTLRAGLKAKPQKEEVVVAETEARRFT